MTVAHVEDRWHRDTGSGRERNERHGRGKRWRARWNDADGRERSRSFDRRADAERHLAAVEGDKLRGTYIDPRAGRITFEVYARDWLATQTFDEKSRQVVEQRLRLHAFPHLGARDLSAVRPSHVQAMIAALNKDLATNHTRAIVTYVSAVFSSAVDDDRIAKNPCRAASVKLPRPDARRITPWPAAQVERVRGALPGPYQVTATIAGGCGLRQGEVFGLAVEDVDFLRRFVRVRRQVKFVSGRYVFALPKGGKTREVPLPDSVALAVSAHIAAHPPRGVTLAWGKPNGEPVTVQLVARGTVHEHLTADHFKTIWAGALKRAGVEQGRHNGMHALRHWYASVLPMRGVASGASLGRLCDRCGPRLVGLSGAAATARVGS